jgi:hypothetical protein
VPEATASTGATSTPARGLLVALLVFAAQKAVFLVLTWVASTRSPGCCLSTSMARNLTRWDGGWYHQVLQDGYSLPDRGFSNLAFFPLLPWTSRLLSEIGVDPRVALVVVAMAGTVAAVAGIHAVGREVAGPRVALLLVALWAVAPRSLVQVMGYTEGPYTAAAAWTLYLCLRGRWVGAGLVAGIAALLRPSVVVLVATLAGCLLTVLVVRARHRPAPSWLPGPWQGAVAVSVPSLALLAVMAHVAAHTRTPLGYLEVQERWQVGNGGILGTLRDVVDVRGALADADAVRYQLLVTLSLLLYVGLLVWMVVLREHRVLVLYVALSVLLVVVVGPFHSKARLLLPAFPAFLPLARLLARAPGWVAVLVVVGLTGVSSWWDLDVVSHLASP